MEKNQKQENPIIKDAFYMSVSELMQLDQDTQRALALKISIKQYNRLDRIEKNVVFFFWVFIINLIFLVGIGINYF